MLLTMALCLPSLEYLCERCLKSLPRLPLPLTLACWGTWLCCGTLTWDDPFRGICGIHTAWTCMLMCGGSSRSDSTCRCLCLCCSAVDHANCPHCGHHPVLTCCALAMAAAPVQCRSDLRHACRQLSLCLKYCLIPAKLICTQEQSLPPWWKSIASLLSAFSVCYSDSKNVTQRLVKKSIKFTFCC